MAYLQFEAIGISSIRCELSVSYVDHNTLQDGFENADDHRYLQSVASKYGIIFSKPGNGICHQVHLERFSKPGKTLIGSDSHTTTAGGMGMIAIGAGGLDVAVAMAGQPFFIPHPKIMRIDLKGKLNPWVSAKDIILNILSILGTKGNVGYIIEYGGDGLQSLDVPARATITNMGAELGVTTSIFPSDDQTHAFLKAQCRENDWVRLEADPDAKYEKILTINLGELEPLIAFPHSPGNIKKVREIAGKNVDQVAIGSCTNSSYMDLMVVANTVKNRYLSSNITGHLAPGSRQVYLMIAQNGALSTLIQAGFRIMESACGFCIGLGCAPSSDAVSIRTNNRNFLGRSGTESAGVYLVSPETAIACALTGKIIDPRDLNIPYLRPTLPERFLIDDNLFILPKNDPQQVIIRGPNISEPPIVEEFKSELKGQISIKLGDKITTDDISPAGFRLKYRSNIPKYASYTFELKDPNFAKNALENKTNQIDNIIVAGESYGQGSSREHVALCPMYLGVKLVISKSFERIHKANLVNFGILPLIFINHSDYDKIELHDQVEIKNISQIASQSSLIVYIPKKQLEIHVKHELSPRQIQILLAGGMLNYAKKN
jgi:aconitate hydratase